MAARGTSCRGPQSMRRKRRLADMAPDPLPNTLLGAHPVRELDLHGLTARDAEGRVRDFIMTSTRAASRQVVRIVTGKGKGSAGQPVLAPLVRQVLSGELSRYVAEFTADVGGGSYLVKIR